MSDKLVLVTKVQGKSYTYPEYRDLIVKLGNLRAKWSGDAASLTEDELATLRGYNLIPGVGK